jgi:hypothetical protein
MLLGVTARIADGQNAANGDAFVRKDALLAFVLITDEDEGSQGTSGSLARPMAEYPGAFDAVKGTRGRWAASVIAGPTACSSPGLGTAKEAARLKQFVTDVGENGGLHLDLHRRPCRRPRAGARDVRSGLQSIPRRRAV